MEYIQPRWCTDDGKAGGEVAFVGYVFFQDEALCKEVQEITELLIGADTRYGFGHLRRIQWKQPKDCFGKRVNLDSKNPLIESRYLLGHLLATDPTFKGALEVLQQWDKEQAHVVGLTWVPGSRVRDDKINIFEILPSGLWERLRNRANHGKGSLRPEQNQARPFNGEGMATWVRR
ncbi:MAG: hypothetical protein H5U36_10040 [Candidatus Caldatribacterium sp.]|nr:hypothetical protein [Candidatus Caldatribacterium sp.]